MRLLVVGIALIGAALLGAGCAKTEVSEGDIKALAKDHNQDTYEAAMRKAGRGKELDEQNKMAAQRGQQGGR